ncbi:hypothetical protein AB1N83_012896 [Pleurotus pulmonarius]
MFYPLSKSVSQQNGLNGKQHWASHTKLLGIPLGINILYGSYFATMSTEDFEVGSTTSSEPSRGKLLPLRDNILSRRNRNGSHTGSGNSTPRAYSPSPHSSNNLSKSRGLSTVDDEDSAFESSSDRRQGRNNISNGVEGDLKTQISMIRNYHRTTNDIPRRDYHNDIDKVQEILATLENLLEEARALDKELKSNYREDYPEEQDNKNHREIRRSGRRY